MLAKIYEALRIINLGFPNYCLGHGLMDLAYNQYLTEYYTQIGIITNLSEYYADAIISLINPPGGRLIFSKHF